MEKMLTVEKHQGLERDTINKQKEVWPSLKDKALKMAKIFAITTVLAVGTPKEAEAQNYTTINKKEQTATPKTQWAEDAVSLMKNDLKYMASGDDVFMLKAKMTKIFRKHIGYMSADRQAEKEYSLDEYKKLLELAQEIQKTMDQLDKKFPNQYGEVIEIEIEALRQRSTYDGYARYTRDKVER